MRKREERGENKKEDQQRWSRSTGVRCSYSRIRWCSHPESHPVRKRFMTLGPPVRTAKTGVIRTTRLFIAGFCQHTSWKVNLRGTCAHTSFLRCSRHRFRNLWIYIYFSLLRHKVMLVFEYSVNIFVKYKRKNRTNTGAHRFFSSIDIGDCVLIKSYIKNRFGSRSAIRIKFQKQF